MEFCQIVPKKLISFVANRPRHLVLAHLVESDEQYTQLYRELKQKTNCTLILDNSMFEYFKRGEPALDSSKLVELGRKIQADYIVLSDYPKQNWTKTRDKAIEMIPEIKSAGFKTFYVPQSELGAIDDLCESFKWAINNRDIDLIGISILACPIGFGVDEASYDAELSGVTRLQRSIARFRLLFELERRAIINRYVIPTNLQNRFHILGMQDAISEMMMLVPFFPMIASWDSSSAVWHAINGIQYDNTPTMLATGKLNTEVNFDWDGQVDQQLIDRINHNINVIDQMSNLRL